MTMNDDGNDVTIMKWHDNENDSIEMIMMIMMILMYWWKWWWWWQY